MQNRQPKYPGRVRMTPVAGQEHIFDMERADEPIAEGTPLNKGTLLQDQTAELFGLTADAVPDDVFAILSKFNMHYWKKFLAVNMRVNIYVYGETVTLSAASKTTTTENVYCADEVAVDGDGVISLVNEETIAVSYDAVPNLGGKYITTDHSYYFYVEPDTKCTKAYDERYYVRVEAKRLFSDNDYSEFEYVWSKNRNEYPDCGTVGEFLYIYSGSPLPNSVGSIKVETGEYVGTGTSGQSYPTMLTFSFIPKLLIIDEITAGGGSIRYFGQTGKPYGPSRYNFSVSGTTLSYYWVKASNQDSSPGNQDNSAGITYRYIGLGFE